MPQQNISIIQGETKNFEFEHQAADVNNRVWFTMYNGRDPVIYKESEKYGGGPDQIEIVATGDKKYIIKIKSNESEKLWLSDVTYKLYWINNQTEEMELLYWGTVNVSPQQQQEQRPKLLGYKYIQVWDQLPNPEDFEEGDIIIIDGQLKTKKIVWENIFEIKKTVLVLFKREGQYSLYIISNSIDLTEIEVNGDGEISFLYNGKKNLLLTPDAFAPDYRMYITFGIYLVPSSNQYIIRSISDLTSLYNFTHTITIIEL